jgi:putative oxidoreductase
MTLSEESARRRSQAVTLLMARLLIAPLYLYSGLGKILSFSGTAARLPGGESLLGYSLTLAAIGAEIGGGVFLVLGLWSSFTATGLAVYSVIVTLMFHQFWAAADHASAVMQTINFLKNVGLIGGLQMIAVFCAGPFAIFSPRNRSALGAYWKLKGDAGSQP